MLQPIHLEKKMKNYIQEGAVLRMTAPYDVASGDGLLVGSLFGVAQITALSGVVLDAAIEGVFELAKTTGAAWTEGAKLYWDDSTKKCTVTASTNKQIGVAVLPASGTMPASGDTTGPVRLTGAFTI